MISTMTNRFRLPLFVRVVALYAVIAVPISLLQSVSHIEQPIASIRRAPPTPAQLVTFQKSTRIYGRPVGIKIARLGIDLQVIDGHYDNATDSWTLSDDKAQFATVTELPNNESGNTFIYGHNQASVFSALAGLQPGDEASISTDNGLTFIYMFNGQQFVDPGDTSILTSSKDPILTLMTCEGVFSEARRVAVFNLKEVL